MRVRCIHSLDELLPLRERINELNLNSALPDPFSTYEFYANLIRSDPAFSDGAHTLWFLAAMRDDELVGYMALKHTARTVFRVRSNTLGFLVGHDADRPHIVAAQDDQCAVADHFFRYLCSRDDWDLLELEQQPADSFLLTPPDSALSRSYRVKLWPNMDNYTIPIQWRSLKDYYQSLSRKFRADVKRGLRRLFAAGDVQLLTTSDKTSAAALLQMYCMIESHSWKASTTLSIKRDTVRHARYSGMLTSQQDLRLIVHILLLDGVPIAGLINGSFIHDVHRRLYALEVIFDDRFSAGTPGSAVLMLGIMHAIDHKYDSYNLLSGFGHYKTRWLAEPTPTHSAQIYRVGSLPFWRRQIGDGRRLLFGTGATQGDLISRRQVGVSFDEQLSSMNIAPEEQASAAALIAQACEGELTHLNRNQLAKLMPFNIDEQAGQGDTHPPLFSQLNSEAIRG